VALAANYLLPAALTENALGSGRWRAGGTAARNSLSSCLNHFFLIYYKAYATAAAAWDGMNINGSISPVRASSAASIAQTLAPAIYHLQPHHPKTRHSPLAWRDEGFPVTPYTLFPAHYFARLLALRHNTRYFCSRTAAASRLPQPATHRAAATRLLLHTALMSALLRNLHRHTGGGRAGTRACLFSWRAHRTPYGARATCSTDACLPYRAASR